MARAGNLIKGFLLFHVAIFGNARRKEGQSDPAFIFCKLFLRSTPT